MSQEEPSITITELKKAFNEYLKSKGFTHPADKALQWNLFWDKIKDRVK